MKIIGETNTLESKAKGRSPHLLQRSCAWYKDRQDEVIMAFAEDRYPDSNVYIEGNLFTVGQYGLYKIEWKAVSFSTRPQQVGEWSIYRLYPEIEHL
jgi:hypothetical protein